MLPMRDRKVIFLAIVADSFHASRHVNFGCDAAFMLFPKFVVEASPCLLPQSTAPDTQ